MDVKEEVKRQVNERAEMECQLATNKPNRALSEELKILSCYAKEYLFLKKVYLM